jgi:type I restriction enzyme S subunit
MLTAGRPGAVLPAKIVVVTRQSNCHLIENSSTKIYPPGTVLIAIIGQGKTRGQSAILDIEACTNQNVAGLVFDAGNIFPEYVWKWALSEYEKTRSGGRGGAQPALNGQKVKNLLIPLPPLAEQKRIVSKVDELMKLCDQLEESLRRAEALAATAVSALAA